MKLTCYKETITAITENATRQLIKLNSLLAEFTRSHHYRESLQIFYQIHSSHRLRPDRYTLSTALKACANLRSLAAGNQLHAHAIGTGFKAYSHVANTLLCLYAKSEDLVSVKRVFCEITHPDVYSWTTLLSACTKLGQVSHACHLLNETRHRNVAVWNAIITGCAENGHAETALVLFRRMHTMGLRHDNYTFASVLSLCGLELLDFGKQLHSLVIKTGFLGMASVINAQLTMYFNCRNVADAYEVFEEAECKGYDQITYNVMIAGLSSTGRDEESFLMFKKMQEVCLRPTQLTFVSVMSSCSCVMVGHNVHALAIKMGFENRTSVSNALITMYSSFGDLHEARKLFNKLEEKDLVSWNALITSYAQGNLGTTAFSIYLEMQRDGIKPDEFTVGSLLGCSGSLAVVEMIHSVVLKSMLILKTEVSNALVSAFSKHGKIEMACKIFREMSSKNLISWNTIISGFQLNGFVHHSLKQFSELLGSGLRPNVYTLTIVLSTCASISSMRHGKQVHGYIIKFGFTSERSLGNALITLYAKCGDLDWSLRVFNAMADKDTVSWNSLISAYAQHGKGREAVNCFRAMQGLGGVKPDQTTFTAVLSACSHAGLVDDGTKVFDSMVNNYGFEPGEDQFSCLVDLFGRAGYLDEAKGLLNTKHIKVDSKIWWALFASCALHDNVRLGRIVAGFLLGTEQKDPTVYVLLSKIYAATGQWEEAANVREQIKSYGVMKQPGCSWISS